MTRIVESTTSVKTMVTVPSAVERGGEVGTSTAGRPCSQLVDRGGQRLAEGYRHDARGHGSVRLDDLPLAALEVQDVAGPRCP